MDFRRFQVAVVLFFLVLQNSNLLVESKETHLKKLDKEHGFCKGINLREITILQLQEALASPSSPLTSVDLVRCYAWRIRTMDPHLHSVLQLNQDAEGIAFKRDVERKLGFLRSPLHGIPILIKDNSGTGDRMETTAGSLALLGLKAKVDAEVVTRLRKAGAVILGKTNPSEFASYRGTNVPEGWSGRGGQTNNAYVLGQNPEGSSSGSAVVVAANLIPVAIGTETSGSIVRPSALASCVGLKTTFGRVSTDGVIPLSFSQDTIGPIARTVADAAIVFGIISKDGLKDTCFIPADSNCTIKNLRLGILRNPNWQNVTVKNQIPAFKKIVKILQGEGVEIIDPVQGSLKHYRTITLENKYAIYRHEFKWGINEYLRTRVRTNLNIFNGQPFLIRNIDDIVAFNTQFPSTEGYNQDYIIQSSHTDGIQNETYKTIRRINQEGAKVYLNGIFKKYQLDAIMVPTNNSELVPDAAGFPHITIPAGFKSNHVPFGVSIYGLPNSEEILLRFALAIEKGFPARRTSSFLP